MANREDEWIQILRKNIRLFNGKGWSIRGMKSGKLKKLQITHRIDDGLQHENPRESILTSIEFVQENSPDIQTLIKKVHNLIYERKVSLAEAYKTTIENSESKIKTKSSGGWIAHAEAYKETKSDRRESTLKDLNFRLELACNLLKAQPKPRNSKDFYLKLKKQYFDKAKMLNGEIKNPKGGNGRLRICNDIAAFLKIFKNIPKKIKLSKNLSINLLLLPEFKINLTKEIYIPLKIHFPSNLNISLN